MQQFRVTTARHHNRRLRAAGALLQGWLPAQPGGQPNPLPQLTLKGRWLEALGFSTGQAVVVTAEKGRLVVEPQRKG